MSKMLTFLLLFQCVVPTSFIQGGGSDISLGKTSTKSIQKSEKETLQKKEKIDYGWKKYIPGHTGGPISTKAYKIITGMAKIAGMKFGYNQMSALPDDSSSIFLSLAKFFAQHFLVLGAFLGTSYLDRNKPEGDKILFDVMLNFYLFANYGNSLFVAKILGLELFKDRSTIIKEDIKWCARQCIYKMPFFYSESEKLAMKFLNNDSLESGCAKEVVMEKVRPFLNHCLKNGSLVVTGGPQEFVKNNFGPSSIDDLREKARIAKSAEVMISEIKKHADGNKAGLKYLRARPIPGFNNNGTSKLDLMECEMVYVWLHLEDNLWLYHSIKTLKEKFPSEIIILILSWCTHFSELGYNLLPKEPKKMKQIANGILRSG